MPEFILAKVPQGMLLAIGIAIKFGVPLDTHGGDWANSTCRVQATSEEQHTGY